MSKPSCCNFPITKCLLEKEKAILVLLSFTIKGSGMVWVKNGPDWIQGTNSLYCIKRLSCWLAFHEALKQPYRYMLSKHSFVFVFHPLPSLSTQTGVGWIFSNAAAAAVTAASSTHRSRASGVRQCVCNSQRQGRNCNCSSSCDDLWKRKLVCFSHVVSALLLKVPDTFRKEL